VRRATQQADVIERASDAVHIRGYGKNFKPLIAAGSWIISSFHYGRSKCACCGRPIRHVLHLKNESHADAVKLSKTDAAGDPFPEEIEIGIVCGPKVFTESCIGFYDDPTREWERQIRAWKDYINYIILCVKNEDTWKRVPDELRASVDKYLEEGYKQAEHSGPWWLLKDAKKKYLKIARPPGLMPEARILFIKARTLVYAAKRLNLMPLHWQLNPDMTLQKETMLPGTYA
jgi:hypothetical protein